MLFEVTSSHAGAAICFRGARKTLLLTFASGSDSFADRHLGAYRARTLLRGPTFAIEKVVMCFCTPATLFERI